MDGMLSHIQEVLEAKNIFERNRKTIKTRALGVMLYHLGVSCRNTSEVVSSFESVSHEAIRNWYHRAAQIFQIEKAARRMIAVYEIKIKIKGRWHILWAAFDIETWDVLGVWIT